MKLKKYPCYIATFTLTSAIHFLRADPYNDETVLDKRAVCIDKQINSYMLNKIVTTMKIASYVRDNYFVN